jgi:hypothetical protein
MIGGVEVHEATLQASRASCDECQVPKISDGGGGGGGGKQLDSIIIAVQLVLWLMLGMHSSRRHCHRGRITQTSKQQREDDKRVWCDEGKMTSVCGVMKVR